MSVAALPLDTPNRQPSLGWMWSIARRIALTGIAIALAGVLIEWPRVAVLMWPVPVSVLGNLAAMMFLEVLFTGLTIGACLECLWWMRDARRTRIQMAIGTAAILAMAMLCMVAKPWLPLPDAILVEYGLVGSLHAFWLFIIWHDLTLGLVAVIYLTRKRQIFAEDTRIAKANREWEIARRAVLESRLQAIQARVEPQLLFDSLSRLRERYQSGIEQGEGLLEALTDFLRCGLPHMRSATGTVFLECELLKTYALLMRSAGFSRVVLTCDLDPEAASMTIAAGGLQGLVAPWLRAASPDHDEFFEIVARRTRDSIKIIVTGPVTDLSMATLATQQTLSEIHGARSSITQRLKAGRLQYVIEYPDDIDQPISLQHEGPHHA